MNKTLALAALLLAGTLGSAFAGSQDSTIQVENPYARAVPPTAANSAAFMLLQNNSDQERNLVSASSDVSEITELHNHINDGGVMRMRQVPQITVPANGSIELKPGSFHVMLIKLKQPLKEGDPVNVTLNFDDGSSQDVAMTAQRVMRPMMHNQEGKKCGAGMKCGGGKCGGMR